MKATISMFYTEEETTLCSFYTGGETTLCSFYTGGETTLCSFYNAGRILVNSDSCLFILHDNLMFVIVRKLSSLDFCCVTSIYSICPHYYAVQKKLICVVSNTVMVPRFQ